MIAYKVINIIGGGRKSFWLSQHINTYAYALDYPVDKTVVAPKGSLGIMAFTDKRLAQSYIDRCPQRNAFPKIIKVRCGQRMKQRKIIASFPRKIARFLKNISLTDKQSDYFYSDPPKGTIFLRSCTPLE